MKDTLILPIIVPNTSDEKFAYTSMLNFSYNGDFGPMLPNEEISCHMMFTLLQCVIYKLSQMDIRLNMNEEYFLTKFCFSLFFTIKKFTFESNICKNLVHSLALCVDSKDVIQREIAIIIDDIPFSGTIFQQLLSLSFARKVRRYQVEHNSKQVSLTELKELSSINAIFILVPLFKTIFGNNEDDIKQFIEKNSLCYHKFLQIHNKESLARDDSKFLISGEICQTMVTLMNDIIGIKIGVPSVQWFAQLFNFIHTNGIAFPRHNETCPINYHPIEIILTKNGKNSQKATYCQGYFVSPSITEYATLELSVRENEHFIVDYQIVANAIKESKTTSTNRNEAQICFLGKSSFPTYLCYNQGGSYSPITGQIYDPIKKTYIPSKIGSFPMIIRLTSKGVAVFDSNNHNLFQTKTSSIIIAIKTSH